jgi:uncharacterized protein YecE (DUF72 family)
LRYWKKKLPAGFCLLVKAPRGLTHARKLYGPETWVQRMSAGWHELGDKRAVLLAQLGPARARDDARLACFLGWSRNECGRGGFPPFQRAYRGMGRGRP